MDFHAAAQWLDEQGEMMSFARSYIRTDRLDAIIKTDPELGGQIEKLCQAVRALRGFAIMMQAESVLTYSAAATEPFVTPVEAFDEMQKLKGRSRLPAEIRDDEVEQYKILQRRHNSEKAIQKIIAMRKG